MASLDVKTTPLIEKRFVNVLFAISISYRSLHGVLFFVGQFPGSEEKFQQPQNCLECFHHMRSDILPFGCYLQAQNAATEKKLNLVILPVLPARSGSK